MHIDIGKMEAFFANITLPNQIKLSECEYISDLPKMVDSHIQTIKSNKDKAFIIPYVERLRKVAQLLKQT